jgi:hypothetical protein
MSIIFQVVCSIHFQVKSSKLKQWAKLLIWKSAVYYFPVFLDFEDTVLSNTMVTSHGWFRVIIGSEVMLYGVYVFFHISSWDH